MRVREIYFRDFRCFRGEHRISFVDPVTDQVRPVSVLAGSNGTGKTTVLETIEGLIMSDSEFFAEVNETGLVCLTLELTTFDLVERGEEQAVQQNQKQGQILNIAVGQEELLPQSYKTMWPLLHGVFVDDANPSHQLFEWVGTLRAMLRGETNPYGGFLIVHY